MTASEFLRKANGYNQTAIELADKLQYIESNETGLGEWFHAEGKMQWIYDNVFSPEIVEFSKEEIRISTTLQSLRQMSDCALFVVCWSDHLVKLKQHHTGSWEGTCEKCGEYNKREEEKWEIIT